MSEFKTWIDPDLCTGDGICEEICPDVFEGSDSGIYHVKESPAYFTDPNQSLADQVSGSHLGSSGMARVPGPLLDLVIEAAEACPGECIFIES